MDEVFAGIICGYGLALVATPAVAIALFRARTNSPLLERLMPQGSSHVAVSVIIHFQLFLGLTAIGMLLGLALTGFADSNPAAGLGSPNRAFTAFIVAVVAIAVLPLAVFSKRLRLPLLAGGLLFTAVFGWLMPWLASWSPTEA